MSLGIVWESCMDMQAYGIVYNHLPLDLIVRLCGWLDAILLLM